MPGERRWGWGDHTHDLSPVLWPLPALVGRTTPCTSQGCCEGSGAGWVLSVVPDPGSCTVSLSCCCCHVPVPLRSLL